MKTLIVIVAGVLEFCANAEGAAATSELQKFLRDPGLRCYFATTPTRIAAGLEACIGRVYCEDVRSKKIAERITQVCKTDAGECPTLEKCADPAFSPGYLRVEDAELTVAKEALTGCWYETPKPLAVWIQTGDRVKGLCATPIRCRKEQKDLPSVAVCEPIDPPAIPSLAAPENAKREPVPLLECPRVDSCTKNSVESYRSEPKQGAVSPQTPLVITSESPKPNSPSMAAPIMSSPSVPTSASPPMPLTESSTGSVARGVRRSVPRGRVPNH